jgi:hypothetical protein
VTSYDPARGPLTIPLGRAPIFYVLFLRGFLSLLSVAMVLAMALICLTSPSLTDQLVTPLVGILFGVLGIGAWWVTDPRTYGLTLDEAGFTCRGPFYQRRIPWRDVHAILPAHYANVVAFVDAGQKRPVVVQGWYAWPAEEVVAAIEAFRRYNTTGADR